jgi:hypothetical protein
MRKVQLVSVCVCGGDGGYQFSEYITRPINTTEVIGALGQLFVQERPVLWYVCVAARANYSPMKTYYANAYCSDGHLYIPVFPYIAHSVTINIGAGDTLYTVNTHTYILHNTYGVLRANYGGGGVVNILVA